jgi:hypothetical protein
MLSQRYPVFSDGILLVMTNKTACHSAFDPEDESSAFLRSIDNHTTRQLQCKDHFVKPLQVWFVCYTHLSALN